MISMIRLWAYIQIILTREEIGKTSGKQGQKEAKKEWLLPAVVGEAAVMSKKSPPVKLAVSLYRKPEVNKRTFFYSAKGVQPA